MIGARGICTALNRHGVHYVVIGALAATLQGSPLRTDDLDVCPEETEENLKRLAAALDEIEALEWDHHKGETIEREWSVETLQSDSLWILVTAHGRLDLVFKPGGTGGYKDLASSAVVVGVKDLEIPVASLASVIRMKEIADRDKDRQQLPTLRRLLERLEENEE